MIIVAKGTLTGFATGLGAAVLLYFLFSHRLAARFAGSLEVSVDGAFLRVRQRIFVLSDRKLHFRSIVDYAVVEDALMGWCGIQTLQMSTTAAGPSSILGIPGVKDCLKVRDTLSEIDRLRENT